MKRSVILIMVFVLLLAAVPVVLAQETTPPVQLPATAGEGVLALVAGLSVLAGLVGNRLTERVKQAFPFLSGEEQTALSRVFIELTAFIFSTGGGWLATHLTPAAAFLDKSGIWAVIVFAYPIAWGFYQVDRRKGG